MTKIPTKNKATPKNFKMLKRNAINKEQTKGNNVKHKFISNPDQNKS